ncbi:LysR family transcriptional regulator [Shewanella sp. 202IG2-18]|uniref:LysR family transcriptional regulator n=1 Tax=Parashewanella hymeniacidonis TaxID=2807618 RepID=UPI0019601219|nr:LysR family transcriptional regulator [Parashewanella hymeniacidonis]MBM7072591.1 LysR family transcriptional regulator [Parashewanella hymeniacidonis]
MKSELLDGMVIFASVVDNGSFTMAAQNCGHSTSYISKEVNKLEQRLGVRLLQRTTRKLKLTPEGQLYYQTCKQIIESAEAIQDGLEGKQIEPQGQLKISCPVGFGIVQLSPIFARFMRAYPKVILDVELNDRKVDLITEGIDVAVRAVHTAEDSSLISRKFGSSYSVTVAAPNYIKEQGLPKCPTELSQHKAVTYSNHKTPNIWLYKDKDNQQLKAELNSVFTANNLDIAMRLCIEGIGIARLPVALAEQAIATGRLVELFSHLPKDNIEFCLIYPSRKNLSAKVRAFINFMLEHFE